MIMAKFLYPAIDLWDRLEMQARCSLVPSANLPLPIRFSEGVFSHLSIRLAALTVQLMCCSSEVTASPIDWLTGCFKGCHALRLMLKSAPGLPPSLRPCSCQILNNNNNNKTQKENLCSLKNSWDGEYIPRDSLRSNTGRDLTDASNKNIKTVLCSGIKNVSHEWNDVSDKASTVWPLALSAEPTRLLIT